MIRLSQNDPRGMPEESCTMETDVEVHARCHVLQHDYRSTPTLTSNMSVDIDWSLLASPSADDHSTSTPPHSDILSSTLIHIINSALLDAPRPSFIGPIQLTSLDFGRNPPDIELRDIRDVWRVFLEADDDDDVHGEGLKDDSMSTCERRSTDPYHDHPEGSWIGGGELRGEEARDDDNLSYTHSMMSPRIPMNVTSVGLGGFRSFAGGGLLSPPLRGTNHILKRSATTSSTSGYQPDIRHTHRTQLQSPSPLPSVEHSSTSRRSNALPDIQLHLHLSHTSDINISLQTSLSVNFPSMSFMSLPLKISVTGFTLAAPDLVLAFSGERQRVYLTILDEEGATDAHVLRNVGKVERFIADALRKTLVDELVFPNFQTIALQ
jgi:distribution and morphology protein 12